VFLAEDLLTHIETGAPAGQNLRYDPVYDQIAEARSEEDVTLPVGAWARQPKKADYPLVLSLAREALAKRSKDLWLAAWLGEAQIRLDGLNALPPVLDLLLRLQERFWGSLYPEIEDNDLGMRAAPLQWAMERYSSLVYDLPAIAESISFRDYQALRRQGSAGESAQAATETLDAALQRTSKAFYVSAESRLVAARQSLERLNLFCDEKYRDDGPSFVKIRSAIDEVYNLVASQLRAKRELEPDPVVIEPAAPEFVTFTPAETVPTQHGVQPSYVETERMPRRESSSDASSTVDTEQRAQKVESPSSAVTATAEPQSWEMALEQIRQCAAYLSQERPASPVPYLVLSAMHQGEMRSDGIGFLKQPPSTELRMALKRLSGQGGGQSLLEDSLRALALPCAGDWLDLHRYIWSASREVGHQEIAESVLDGVRAMLRRNNSIMESVFEDDTPTASPETRQWIDAEVRLSESSPPMLEKGAVSEAPQALPGRVSTAEAASVQSETDVRMQADALAANGDLAGSIQLLMMDAAASPARRISFRQRLHASRLCLAHGQKVVARRLLEQLLAEADEYRLEVWEGSHLMGEVMVLLLQSLDEQEESERGALLGRLCQVDPARALSVEVRT
jgi:type VI secretion system protein ImpA